MSHHLIELYQPINTLKLVDENIWIVDGSVVRMAMYGMMIPFSTRMTIVRLNNGELWCHSPIALTEGLKTEIDSLGLVRHLISPNKIHYVHISTWAKARLLTLYIFREFSGKLFVLFLFDFKSLSMPT